MSSPGPPPGLTRRAVLGGAAAAGAAALVRPVPGLAAVRGDGRGVFSRWVGLLAGESAAIAAPRRFTLVGVEWVRHGGAHIELRTRLRGGDWSRWSVASALGHGPDRSLDGSITFGEPIWTGPADYVQLRCAGEVRGVRLHFVAPGTGAPKGEAVARASEALPLAGPVLDAGPGQPPVIARSAWARGQAPPAVPPHYGVVKLAFVHHSQTPNGYGPADVPGILLSIFDYHRYVRGYWDIAYNFAIDAFGRIWEGRAGGIDKPVLGAHAGGYNAQSTGVVVLGSYMDVVPPPAAIDALAYLLAWKLSLHGVPALGPVTVQVSPFGGAYSRFTPGSQVSLPRVAGHRDGDSTNCPGDAFYAQLPSIRPRIAQLAGVPLKLTLLPSSTAVTAGTTIALSGRLAQLGGAAIGGAPVQLQLLASGGEQTIDQLTTGADGTWSASIAPIFNSLLRAIHSLPPAAVSPLTQIAVAPVVTLSLASPSPPGALVVSGQVSPPKPGVTIELYRRRHGRRRLVRTTRLGTSNGLFRARIRTRAAGRYVVIARTAADARNAAGASQPLHATV